MLLSSSLVEARDIVKNAAKHRAVHSKVLPSGNVSSAKEEKS